MVLRAFLVKVSALFSLVCLVIGCGDNGDDADTHSTEIRFATSDTVDWPDGEPKTGDGAAEAEGEPCEPNPCQDPPEPQCEGDGLTLVVFSGPGACSLQGDGAVCDYPESISDCSEVNAVCQDGECVQVDDPCQPNPCVAPPDDFCEDDGGTLVSHGDLGECVVVDGWAQCSYPEAITDCQADGGWCVEAECVNPCAPNPCTKPPGPACEDDGVILLSYDFPGECTLVDGEPTCEYPPIPIDCTEKDMVCKDDNCVLLGVGNTPTEPGQIVFTEIMAKSQAGSDKGEWFELYNAGEEAVDLKGCLLTDDGTDSHEIEKVMVVKSGAFLLLARSGDPTDNFGLEPHYVYGGMTLTNASDELVLVCGEEEIDHVAYSAWMVNEGVAAQLSPEKMSSLLNDLEYNWCLATEEYGTGGKLGTPGWANSECPPADPCLGNPCTDPPPDECLEDEITLITHDETGLCADEDGEPVCTYSPVELDCSKQGKACLEGQCVEVPGDPCLPNPCITPPEFECDDKTMATQYEPIGACTPVEELPFCEYAGLAVNCAESDLVCLDGVCVPEGAGNTPGPGQIIFTEFMAKSQSGPDNGEWVEVHNLAEELLDLSGCVLKDDGDDNHTIASALIIVPGGHAVLARSELPIENHGLEPDYVYAGFVLANGGDELVLECDGQEIDRVEYADILVEEGVAAQLDLPSYDATLNDFTLSWCPALDEYGTAAKLGTPGLANYDCPEVDPCDPNPCDNPPPSQCADDEITLITYEAPGQCTVDAGLPQCLFVEALVDCQEDGKICFGGNCVEPSDSVQPSVVGEVIFSEFMPRSQSGSDSGEWVEVYNNSDKKLELGGCVLKDAGTDEHLIVGPLSFAPGEFLLLARSDDPVKNHGLPVPLYKYAKFTLSNTDDEIILVCGEVEIDQVVYDEDWVMLGEAMQLGPDNYDHEANDLLGSWCLATAPYGTAGKLGTPSSANEQCPEPLSVGWCRLQWPLDVEVVGAFEDLVYGRVYVDGITDLTGGPDSSELLKGQAGVGPDGTDPAASQDWTWFDADTNQEWVDTDEPGNDEYMATASVAIAGAYDIAYRFSADAGVTWVYCDRGMGPGSDGSEDGYQVENAGGLTVLPEGPQE